jgi:branched-chain amino acid transport system ATP-binding protein
VSDLLTVEDLRAGYGEAIVLEGLSFGLAAGQSLALLGRNGAGKTTLINTLIGATRHRGGKIGLNGVDITGHRSDRRAAAGIGWVPQERNIFKSLTVEENLTAVARPGPWGVARVFEMFPRLAERRRNMGNQLSGGEQQMLAVGRALMLNPRLMLLDEPLEGLAPVICEQLMQAFEQLAADRRRTVVLVEQHAAAALAFATRAVVITNGSIVYDGSATALKQQPELLERHIGVAHR